MRVNFRYPNITGTSEKAQIVQIKSYLHQLVEQLNNELPTLSSGDGSTQNFEEAYYGLRSTIGNEIREIKSLIEQLSAKMEFEYVTKEELQAAIEALSASAADT